MQFNHFSVLLNESVENLNIKQHGIYVDCTLGGGGHSAQILNRLNDKGKLIAIDQDEYAIDYCKKKFGNNNNITFVNDNFKNIKFCLFLCNLYCIGIFIYKNLIVNLLIWNKWKKRKYIL